MSQNFQKGDDIRTANTAADEVALRFRGFVPVATNAMQRAVVDYRDLQVQAKELGIPANQTAQELTDAIAQAEDEQYALDASYEGVPE